MADGYRHKLRAHLESLRWTGRNDGLRVLNARQIGRLVIELEPTARAAEEATRLREALTEIARLHPTHAMRLDRGQLAGAYESTRRVLDRLHLDRLETRLKERP
jgi:hypothetical protein